MRLAPRVVSAKIRIAIARRLPDKPVARTVHGVPMMLPRGHVLPYYAHPGSAYGRNLIELGEQLAARDGATNLLDIGANVGDTALMVLEHAPGVAVCVEPDPAWQRYLDLNVGSRDDVVVEQSAIVGPGDGNQFAIVHEAVGTSRLEAAAEGEGMPTISTDELLARHPQLAGVRLIKTDTDGYDIALTPHLARTFAGSRPVIFLEFDPRPTALVTPDVEPAALWAELDALGYERAVVWDNGGNLIGAFPTPELTARTAELAGDLRELGYEFWDVAVAHRDDATGLAALDALSRADAVTR